MSIPVECDNAIVAHAAWKAKFRAFLSGTLTLDPVVVEKHNGCDFGKWLEGAGRSHLQAAEYERLHKLHAEFHRVAAGVVRLKLGGDVKGAQAQVEASGAFSKASAALTREVVVVRDTKR